MGKLEGLLKKHRIKLLGFWIVLNKHLSYGVYEASSPEAFKKFGEEPDVWAAGAYDTSETKMAVSLEEAMQILQNAT